MRTVRRGSSGFCRQPGPNATGRSANDRLFQRRTPTERSRKVTFAEAASRWIALHPLERYRNVSKTCFTPLCLFSFKFVFFFRFILRSEDCFFFFLSFIEANPHFSSLHQNFCSSLTALQASRPVTGKYSEASGCMGAANGLEL